MNFSFVMIELRVAVMEFIPPYRSPQKTIRLFNITHLNTLNSLPAERVTTRYLSISDNYMNGFYGKYLLKFCSNVQKLAYKLFREQQ